MSTLEREALRRLEAVRARIAAACARVGRPADEVRLIGISKRQPLERVAATVRAGVRDLGENYIQELATRARALPALLPPDAAAPRWRMVGALQRNKARLAAEICDAVDTVDRERIAVELDKRAQAAGRRLEVCLQVNLSGEPQKNGVAPAALPALLEACAALPALRVVGLMTVPAAADDPEAARPVFARLRELRDTLARSPGGASLRELSMGMSGDLEVAVEEGATMVRVGTALFGERAR